MPDSAHFADLKTSCSVLCTGVGIVLAGCASTSNSNARAIGIGDFANPPADLLRAGATDVVEMSPEILEGPTVEVEGVGVELGDRTVGEARGVITSQNADGTTTIDAASPIVVDRVIEPGQSWPIESLVGQVNGRPVFADVFFEPLEDRLLIIAAMQDRTEARRALIELVRRAFKETVDSELVVAEAEAKLSPEQQQGLFAWLKTIQEETIAERGGSRAAAEASLEVEETQTLEEFLQQQRDVALARRLLNERISPRTIVAWRDVEQEYARRTLEFNPLPTLKIGRIRLSQKNDAAQVAQVKEWIKAGKKFSEIAAELKLPDGGLWNQFDLPPDGIKGLQLASSLVERLDGLAVDAVSAPLEQPEYIMWLTVLEIDQRVHRSIFNQEVQLQLQAELKGRREIIERERYLATLRSRWVTDDILAMERRLLEIAVERYWR